MSRIRVWTYLVTLLVALPLLSSTPQQDVEAKPAWLWSDEERIRSLVDNYAAATRVQRARAKEGPSAASATNNDRYDVFFGDENPELFLPHDLFDNLLAMGTADSVASFTYRHANEPARKRLGLPDDFWTKLDAIAAPYLADKKAERDHFLHGKFVDDVDALRNEMCRKRYDALVECRRTFGPAFDEFLYTAVVANMFHVSFVKPVPDVLRRLSRGCR